MFRSDPTVDIAPQTGLWFAASGVNSSGSGIGVISRTGNANEGHNTIVMNVRTLVSLFGRNIDDVRSSVSMLSGMGVKDKTSPTPSLQCREEGEFFQKHPISTAGLSEAVSFTIMFQM
jgi:hypothetical protein